METGNQSLHRNNAKRRTGGEQRAKIPLHDLGSQNKDKSWYREDGPFLLTALQTTYKYHSWDIKLNPWILVLKGAFSNATAFADK